MSPEPQVCRHIAQRLDADITEATRVLQSNPQQCLALIERIATSTEKILNELHRLQQVLDTDRPAR